VKGKVRSHRWSGIYRVFPDSLALELGKRVVEAKELGDGLGELLDELGGDPQEVVLLTRSGQPKAVLLDWDSFLEVLLALKDDTEGDDAH
jgi:hypothetical protein